MNKITKEEAPELFKNIDFSGDIENDYRGRGSTFYVTKLVIINEGEGFDEYIGNWETNSFIIDTEYGWNKSDIRTLERVEEVEEIIITKKWKKIAI